MANMLSRRLISKAFWRIYVQVLLLQGLGRAKWFASLARQWTIDAAARVIRLAEPPTTSFGPRRKRPGPTFAHVPPGPAQTARTQIRTFTGLAAIKVARAAEAAANRPKLAAALAAYLLLAFALEYVVIQSFPPPAPGQVGIMIQDTAGCVTHHACHECDDDDLADMLATMLGVANRGLADRLAPATTAPPCLALAVSGFEDLSPRFRLPPPPGPHGGLLRLWPKPLPKVRLAVSRHVIRMPVDRFAFHPQDKESLLATASSRMRSLFASVPDAVGRKKRAKALAAAKKPAKPRTDRKLATVKLPRPSGKLAAMFESGLKGVHAIGYDPKGGTSYGKYQLSSRKGTMRMFIAYLKTRMPLWAERLSRSGRSNTLSTRGEMPRAWRRLAKGNPLLFETLQDDFIHKNFYSPTLRAVAKKSGLDLNTRPAIFREVLLSTAVQHGPTAGAGIFIEAASRVGGLKGKSYNRALLEEIFQVREQRIVNRALSSYHPALKKRLKQERSIALAMLQNPALDAYLF